MFRSPRLGLDELGVQCVGKPRYDFVLHVEQVGDGLVETIGPEVVAGFGVDQAARLPEGGCRRAAPTFKHVADV